MKILYIFLSCFITISVIKNQYIIHSNDKIKTNKKESNPEDDIKSTVNFKIQSENIESNYGNAINKNDEDRVNKNKISKESKISDYNETHYDNEIRKEGINSINKETKVKNEYLNTESNYGPTNLNDKLTNVQTNSNNKNDGESEKEIDELLPSQKNEDYKNENKKTHKPQEMKDNNDLVHREKKINNIENYRKDEREKKEDKTRKKNGMNVSGKINSNTGNHANKANNAKKVNAANNKNIATNDNHDLNIAEEIERPIHDEKNLKYKNSNDEILSRNKNETYNNSDNKFKLSKLEFVKICFDILAEIFLIIKIGIIYRYTHFLIPLKNLIISNALIYVDLFLLTCLTLHRKISEQYKNMYGLFLIVFFIYLLKFLISQSFFNKHKKSIDKCKDGKSENIYIENLLKRILFNLEKKKNLSNFENLMNDILENTDNILVNINMINKENKNIYTDMISNINNIGIFTYISTQALKKINQKSDLIISEITTNRLIDDDDDVKIKSSLMNEYDENEINNLKDNFLNEYNKNDTKNINFNALNSETYENENEANNFLNKAYNYELDNSINEESNTNNDINNKNAFYYKNVNNDINNNRKGLLKNLDDVKKLDYDNFNSNYIKGDDIYKGDNLLHEDALQQSNVVNDINSLKANLHGKNTNSINSTSKQLQVTLPVIPTASLPPLNGISVIKGGKNSFPINEHKNELKKNKIFSEGLNDNELIDTKDTSINKNVHTNNQNSLNNISELNKNFNNLNNVYNLNSGVNSMAHAKESHKYENDFVTNQTVIAPMNVSCNFREKSVIDEVLEKPRLNSTNSVKEEPVDKRNEDELNINKSLINNYSNKERIESNEELVNNISNPNEESINNKSNPNATPFDHNKNKNHNLTNDNFIGSYSYMPASYQLIENSPNRNQKYITQRKERQKIVATKSPFKNVP